ncbi:MAG: TRAP transporter substrate-binding protein DctP [Schwartzia sp.]|nr:TRAP transporter substrate-binding protein DctP [Schwartzia sp. (in: firmicutes)]
MKRVAALVLFVCAFLAFGCGGKHEEPSAREGADGHPKVRLVMATTGTDAGTDTVVARRFAELVRDGTGGAVTIEVYTKDQLAGGNTTKGVEMLANGSVDFAAYTSSNLSMLDPRLAVATLPWAFEDMAAARQTISATGGAYYEKRLAQQGLLYLGFAHNGMRQISSTVWRVRTPEDLKFLKIRVPGNKELLHFYTALGAVPMPMSWSELPDALRQGVVDGYETGFAQSVTAGLDRMTKYATVLNYAYEPYLFIANRKTFDHLDEGTKRLLREKAAEACAWGCDLMEKNEAEARQRFVKSGVLVTELSSEERDAFRRETQPVVEQLKSRYGEEACRAFGIPWAK